MKIRILILALLISLQSNAMHEYYVKSDEKTVTPTSSFDEYNSDDDASLVAYIKDISSKLIPNELNSTNNSKRDNNSKKLPKMPTKTVSNNIYITDMDTVITPSDNNVARSKLPQIQRKQSLDIDYKALQWLKNNDGDNYIEAATVDPDFIEYRNSRMNNSPTDTESVVQISTTTYQPIQPAAPRSSMASRSPRQRPAFLGSSRTVTTSNSN